MKRYTQIPRPNYAEHLERIGFLHHSLPSGVDGKEPYWQEDVMYYFSEKEIDVIQMATQELHDMSKEMVGDIVQSGDYPDYFRLTDIAKAEVEKSWKRRDPTLMGRFDLAYTDENNIKLLEYNGDTPVSLLEASLAAWDHVTNVPNLSTELRTQYNLLHETLIEFWQKNYMMGETIHFTQSDGFRSEDRCNLLYLQETAYEAGLKVKEIDTQNIGYSSQNKFFIDLEYEEIKTIMKLYPWEWMFQENFADKLSNTETHWLEPQWKTLLSNKAMLIELWKRHPNHPYLLASFSEDQVSQLDLSKQYCKKAIHGREGANIYKYDPRTKKTQLGKGSHIIQEYDQWGYMYQEWTTLPVLDNRRPILGSWVIGDQACGMSVREDSCEITGNGAYFANHLFVPYDHMQQYKTLY